MMPISGFQFSLLLKQKGICYLAAFAEAKILYESGAPSSTQIVQAEEQVLGQIDLCRGLRQSLVQQWAPWEQSHC